MRPGVSLYYFGFWSKIFDLCFMSLGLMNIQFKQTGINCPQSLFIQLTSAIWKNYVLFLTFQFIIFEPPRFNRISREATYLLSLQSSLLPQMAHPTFHLLMMKTMESLLTPSFFHILYFIHQQIWISKIYPEAYHFLSFLF